MLIERNGIVRTPPCLSYKQTRGHYFLSPLFAYLRSQRAADLSGLEVGCSFGYMTEYLAEQFEVAELYTFDTDPSFVALTRAKVDEFGLSALREVAHFSNDAAKGHFTTVAELGARVAAAR